MSHSDVIRWMDNKVKKLKVNMMLDDFEEVYVVPKVKCDVVLKSSFLEDIKDCMLGNDVQARTCQPILGNSEFIIETDYSFL
jgi:hypothetical protein